MKPTPNTITDHALVRYMERVMGLPVEVLRAQIAEATADAIKVGASSVRINGWVFRIKNGVVVTVVSRSSAKRFTYHGSEE